MILYVRAISKSWNYWLCPISGYQTTIHLRVSYPHLQRYVDITALLFDFDHWIWLRVLLVFLLISGKSFAKHLCWIFVSGGAMSAEQQKRNDKRRKKQGRKIWTILIQQPKLETLKTCNSLEWLIRYNPDGSFFSVRAIWSGETATGISVWQRYCSGDFWTTISEC